MTIDGSIVIQCQTCGKMKECWSGVGTDGKVFKVCKECYKKSPALKRRMDGAAP